MWKIKAALFLVPRLIFWNWNFKRINKIRTKNPDKFARKWPIERRWAYINKCTAVMARYMGVKFSYSGYENVPSVGGAVIISNHQSNADPLMMFSAIKRPAKFIAKVEIKKFFTIGAGGDLVDTIWLDRGNQSQTAGAFLEAVKAVRREGKIMIIYPEGTRSGSETIGEFKVDAFEMAKMTKAPIVPAKFTNAWKALNKNYKPKRNDTATLKFLEPISYEQYSQITTEELAILVKDKIMKG